MAWTRRMTVEIKRSEQSQGVFYGQTAWELQSDWMWEMRDEKIER